MGRIRRAAVACARSSSAATVRALPVVRRRDGAQATLGAGGQSELGGRSSNCPALCAIETHGSPPGRGEAAARGGTAQSVGHPPLSRRRARADSLPENRLHGVVAGKLYTYASDARIRRGPTESRSQEKGTPA